MSWLLGLSSGKIWQPPHPGGPQPPLLLPLKAPFAPARPVPLQPPVLPPPPPRFSPPPVSPPPAPPPPPAPVSPPAPVAAGPDGAGESGETGAGARAGGEIVMAFGVARQLLRSLDSCTFPALSAHAIRNHLPLDGGVVWLNSRRALFRDLTAAVLS